MYLNISEKFLLLALDVEKGKFKPFNKTIKRALSGAILLELTHLNDIIFDNNHFFADTLTKPKDIIFQDIQKEISKSLEPKSINYWVEHLTCNIKKPKHNIINSLVFKGVLRKECKNILFVIQSTIYHLSQYTVRRAIVNELRDIVLKDRKPIEEELLLLAIMYISKLYNFISRDISEFQLIEQQIEKIIEKSEITNNLAVLIKEFKKTLNEVA